MSRPNLSRLTRGFHVLVRPALLTSAAGVGLPRGVVDQMSDLGNVDLDVARIHPDVARFFDDTAGLDLLIRSRWSFPFSIVFVLFRWAMKWVGQFYLPPHNGEATIKTRAVPIDPAKDGRDDVRGIFREYPNGDVMQVVLYATHTDARGSRYMNATFPLPFGSVTGILRVDAMREDGKGQTGIALTSAQKNGDDAAVWLQLGPLVFRAPLAECIELWTASMDRADEDVFPGATIAGRHVQKIFGVTFATHRYWFRPAPLHLHAEHHGPRSKIGS